MVMCNNIGTTQKKLACPMGGRYSCRRCMRHNPGKDNRGRVGYDGSVGSGRRRRGIAVVQVLLAILTAIVLSGGVGQESAAAEPTTGTLLVAGVRRFSFPAPAEMTRVDVYTWIAQTNPQAVLVLCPGFNGDGETLIRQSTWQTFARANHLALCSIFFVSPEAEVQSLRGYIHAERGSGDLLLEGIRLGFGRDLPILIYGFSCGARFAVSVADWKPARVLSWCAYSASWWEEPQISSSTLPPGIVACGEEDAANYGTSTTFFIKGRAAGLPWTWVSLGHTGHVWSEPLSKFVRAYFAAVLRIADMSPAPRLEVESKLSIPAGSWRDVDTKAELSQRQVLDQPVLASWLPVQSLVSLWCALHCP